ncbi:hypothetical protein IAT38_007389 [Cryptococcus sp. DSM 104549]
MQSPHSSSPVSRRTAADLDRDAKAEADTLRQVLASQPPWSKEVELYRQQCRNLHLTLLFSHPLSPYAQSLDPLWHQTTYILIQSYRELVARLEHARPPPQPRSQSRRGNSSPAHTELKKAVTRFRQALASEETFYRSLVARLSKFYALGDLPGCRTALAGVKIPAGDAYDDGDDAGSNGGGIGGRLGTGHEKKDKLTLVYKGLICLGDLERYKEQYRQPVNSGPLGRGGAAAAGRGEEKFGAAKNYYRAAWSLQPDEGIAFNQMAVISTYLGDDFEVSYHYIRALAIRNEFRDIENILRKHFSKQFDRWRAARGKGSGSEEDGAEAATRQGGKDEVTLWKEEVVAWFGVIYIKVGFTFLPELQPRILSRLTTLLRSRLLSTESIVHLTAIAIGVHFRARSTAGLGDQDPLKLQRSHDAETKALEAALELFSVYLSVVADEIEEARQSVEGAVADEEEDEGLPQLISAVVKRILPSLRVISKWLKLNLEYLSRQSTPRLPEFWAGYTRLVVAVDALFPIARLPSLGEPLEEDKEMRGFAPLYRGVTAEPRAGEGDGLGDGLDGGRSVHPNEEHLMRLADLQVDARLIIHNQLGSSLINGTAPNPLIDAMPDSTFSSYREPDDVDDQGDLASVSTDTENDPVNLAMRATLGTGSSVGDEEEVIVWDKRPRNPVNGYGAAQDSTLRGNPAAAPPKPKHTAYDLLANLVLEPAPTPVAPPPGLTPSSSSPYIPGSPAYPPMPSMPNIPSATVPGAYPGTTTSSPRIAGLEKRDSTSDFLFGGGSGIWGMTREESEKGKKRAVGSGVGVGGATVAGIWGESGSPAAGAPAAGRGQSPGAGASAGFGATYGQVQQPQPQQPQYHQPLPPLPSQTLQAQAYHSTPSHAQQQQQPQTPHAHTPIHRQPPPGLTPGPVSTAAPGLGQPVPSAWGAAPWGMASVPLPAGRGEDVPYYAQEGYLSQGLGGQARGGQGSGVWGAPGGSGSVGGMSGGLGQGWHPA